MEWRSNHNLSRREIYHVRRERGELIPYHPMTGLSHVPLAMGVCGWQRGKVQRRRAGVQGMYLKDPGLSHSQVLNTGRA